jgi:hypothetical protein
MTTLAGAPDSHPVARLARVDIKSDQGWTAEGATTGGGSRPAGQRLRSRTGSADPAVETAERSVRTSVITVSVSTCGWSGSAASTARAGHHAGRTTDAVGPAQPHPGRPAGGSGRAPHVAVACRRLAGRPRYLEASGGTTVSRHRGDPRPGEDRNDRRPPAHQGPTAPHCGQPGPIRARRTPSPGIQITN